MGGGIFAVAFGAIKHKLFYALMMVGLTYGLQRTPSMGGGVSKKDSESEGAPPDEEECAEVRFICDSGRDLPELATSVSNAEAVLGIIVPADARTFPRTGMRRLTKLKHLLFERGSQLRHLPFGVFIGARK